MRTRKFGKVAGVVAAGSAVVAPLAVGAVSASSSEADRPPSSTGSVAQSARHDQSTTSKAHRAEKGAHGTASMSSAFIAGVWHVPADVLLSVDSTGQTVYIGPAGSFFNGPTHEADQRVDEWWAKQMAAGVTPKAADRLLATHPQ